MTGAASGARFLTTLPYTRRAAWTARAEIVDPISVVRRAGSHEAVVLNGSVRGTSWPRPSRAAAAGRPWSSPMPPGRGRRAAPAGRRSGPRPRDAHYCVLSQEEAALFPATWGVAPDASM